VIEEGYLTEISSAIGERTDPSLRLPGLPLFALAEPDVLSGSANASHACDARTAEQAELSADMLIRTFCLLAPLLCQSACRAVAI